MSDDKTRFFPAQSDSSPPDDLAALGHWANEIEGILIADGPGVTKATAWRFRPWPAVQDALVRLEAISPQAIQQIDGCRREAELFYRRFEAGDFLDIGVGDNLAVAMLDLMQRIRSAVAIMKQLGGGAEKAGNEPPEPGVEIKRPTRRPKSTAWCHDIPPRDGEFILGPIIGSQKDIEAALDARWPTIEKKQDGPYYIQAIKKGEFAVYFKHQQQLADAAKLLESHRTSSNAQKHTATRKAAKKQA